jgi:hypothetical protein
MSIIVKGMKMPENCAECINSDLRTTIRCTEWTEISAGRRENERAWSCPLVDLGKHGDLIDRDAFKAGYGMKDDCADCEKEMRGKVKMCEYDRIYSKMDFCGWLDDALTLVEAEDSE